MSNVKITHTVDGTVSETMVTNPEHVKVLVNVQEVAVDGRVFDGVVEVAYND
jgi:hypothetical protein